MYLDSRMYLNSPAEAISGTPFRSQDDEKEALTYYANLLLAVRLRNRDGLSRVWRGR